MPACVASQLCVNLKAVCKNRVNISDTLIKIFAIIQISLPVKLTYASNLIDVFPFLLKFQFIDF
jgi:hypothetical protein